MASLEEVQAEIDRRRRKERLANAPGGIMPSVEFSKEELTEARRPPRTDEELAKNPARRVAGRLLNEVGLGIVAASAAPVIAPAAGAGALLTAAGLAGLGAAGGSLLSERFDPTTEEDLFLPQFTEDPATQRAIETGGIEAVGEGVGRAVGQVVSTVRSGGFLRKSLVEGGEEAFETVRSGGGMLTPGLLTDRRLVDTVEEMLDASLFGGRGLTKAHAKAEQIAADAADEFIDSFRSVGGREQIGQVLLDSIDEGSSAFKVQAARFYGEVDRLIGDAVVDTAPLKEVMEARLNEVRKGLGSPAVEGFATRIESLPERISFQDAQILRSDLLSVGPQTGEVIATKAKGAAATLAGTLDSSMQAAARGQSPEALRAWRNANRFWKGGAETFNNRLIRSIAKSEPDRVFQRVIANKSPGTIRRMRKIVMEGENGAETWEAVQGEFLRDLFSESTPATLGAKELPSAAKAARKLKQLGEPALNELFPNAAKRNLLKRNLRTLEITQSRAAGAEGGPGRVVMQLSQGGAVVDLFGLMGGIIPNFVSISILVTPAIAVKLLTNAETSKWLTVGNAAPEGSKALRSAFGQLLAQATAEGARIETFEEQDRAPNQRREFIPAEAR